MRRKMDVTGSPRRERFEMITFLHGKLVEALPTQIVVDVNGVGYEALIPLSSFDKLPQHGQPVHLLETQRHEREHGVIDLLVGGRK